MIIHLTRLVETKQFGGSSVGMLQIDGRWKCWTLEDEERIAKVHGETRIPEGSYTIKLRTDSSPFNDKYAARFGSFHRGMLWLQNVPNFSFIYLHTGNREFHSDGCILVGNQINNPTIEAPMLGDSTRAYTRVYGEVIAAIELGQSVEMKINKLHA